MFRTGPCRLVLLCIFTLGLVQMGSGLVGARLSMASEVPDEVGPPDAVHREPPGESGANARDALADIAGRHGMEVLASEPVHLDPQRPHSAGVVTFALPDRKSESRFMKFAPEHRGSDCCLRHTPETEVLAEDLCALDRGKEWELTWVRFFKTENGERGQDLVYVMSLHCEGRSVRGFHIGDDLSGASVFGCFKDRSIGPHDHSRREAP